MFFLCFPNHDFLGGWGGGGLGDEDDIGFVFNKYGFCVQVYI